MQTKRVPIINRLHFSPNHSILLNLFSMRNQHPAIAMITQQFIANVPTFGLKIVPKKKERFT